MNDISLMGASDFTGNLISAPKPTKKMNLKEQAKAYIESQNTEAIAGRLGVKPTTVVMWRKTGNYPVSLIQLMMDSQEPLPATTAQPFDRRPLEESTWTEKDFDAMDEALSSYGKILFEFNQRITAIEERFTPKAITPQLPTRTVPPGENLEVLAANATRPGGVAPTPHLIGQPVAVVPIPPPAQPEPVVAGGPPHWSIPYDYKSARK